MFYSIMFPTEKQDRGANKVPPDYFTDLNLEQIILPLLQGKEEYGLETFFFTPCQDISVVEYRQKIMEELANPEKYKVFKQFTDNINIVVKAVKKINILMNERRSQDSNYFLKGQFFHCIECYCVSVENLLEWAVSTKPISEGLKNFLEELQGYVFSTHFQRLTHWSKDVRKEFAKLEYCMFIKDGKIRVRKYEQQENISVKILETFKKFQQADAQDYRQELADMPFASHVEEEVMKLLSKVFPQEFAHLDSLCQEFPDFLNSFIVDFAKEIQFYFIWLELVKPMVSNGLSFCYPQMSEQVAPSFAKNFYDLALAQKIGRETIPNDFSLDNQERIMVVTGPNQGGKTTFARAIGQITYLAAVGLCIPGTSASLMLPDNIFTHFGKEEDITTLNGQLADDLERLHELLSKATSRSLIIVNEIFSSTTAQDALLLGEKMMGHLKQLQAMCLVVTFIDELSQDEPGIVSLVSSVRDDEPDKRTYKIQRAKAMGLAYALEIAKRHRLTYEQLDGRLKHAGSSDVCK